MINSRAPRARRSRSARASSSVRSVLTLVWVANASSVRGLDPVATTSCS
jgi:hypothetical protein